MLINFACQNFRSIKESITFSTIASKVTRMDSHLVKFADHRILRGSFLFGANASGKSNFVKAIDFARRIVCFGFESVSCDGMHFRLANEAEKVGVFQFNILACDKKFYSYGFAIDYFNHVIAGEWLYDVTDAKEEICVFSRERDEATSQYSVKTGLELEGAENNRFEVYCEDFMARGMRRTLFLVDVAKRGGNMEFARGFQAVRKWFQKLIVLFPDSKFTGDPSYAYDVKDRNTISELLKHFDTGIEKIINVKIDPDRFWDSVPLEIREKLKIDVSRALLSGTSSAGHTVVTVNNPRASYSFYMQDGELRCEKVASDHGNPKDPFERGDESEGTQRLFDLIPLYKAFEDDIVVVIDEIDRSLHTKATREFVRLFYENEKTNHSQLIATTHDAELLDLDALRQDEIWFVDRNKDKCSQFYPLTKFKARFDKDIKKEYFLGRYGALPIFDSFADLESEE